MKQILITVAFSIIAIATQAQIPSGYYNSAAGLEGEPLRESLRGIISSGHSTNSYDDLYGYYETTDNYTNGKVWDMYTMKADGTANDWFTHHSDKCGSYAAEFDCYNREHSAPQSWFGSSYPMQADLFIVYPTDGKVNGMRSNYPFGETSSTTNISSNGSNAGSCSYPGYSGTVFEPIDRFKGDFARTYFYVATRYKNQVEGWSGNADIVFTGNNLSAWQINMLLEWDAMDPVSQKEIDRNNAVYPIQGNRNPYIDHPEWVSCVWSTCTGLNFTSMPITAAIENTSYIYDITYNVDLETEDLLCTTKPSWLSFSKNLDNNTAQLVGTAQTADIGNHSVVLELTEDGVTEIQEFTIIVSPWTANTDIINVDFASCLPNGWETVNDAGDHDWLCSAGYYTINGYGADQACEDWLISKPIDMSVYENETFAFDSWTQWDDAGIAIPEVKLKYSSDYDGQGNPSGATWTELIYTFPAEDSQTWTNSGLVDITSVNGTNVYFAFYYTSSGTGASQAAFWQIDNVVLNADHIIGIDKLSSLVNIYPNPATDILNFNNIENVTRIVILNTIGQTVFVKENRNHSLQINTKNYPVGLYFVKFESNKGTFTKKIIKQ